MQPEKITTKSREEKIALIVEGMRSALMVRIQFDAILRILGGDGVLFDKIFRTLNYEKMGKKMAFLTQSVIAESIVDEIVDDFSEAGIDKLIELHKEEIINNICARLNYDSKSNHISIDGEIF